MKPTYKKGTWGETYQRIFANVKPFSGGPMTSEEQFVPESPLVDAYLAAAATDHTGHKALDLAVWYALAQNFINRRYIQFLGQPFRVHFFAVAKSRFGKSSSLDFGFVRFLGAYSEIIGHEHDVAFIDLSGQNTAAGLIDAMNNATDPYKHQILTAWVDETTYVFPKFMGRREQDIANLLSNVLFGRRDVRYVRERGKKLDSVDRPIINACFPATPDQYVELMKGTSSSDILKRFLLLAPTASDGRNSTPFTRCALNLDPALEKFMQWLNVLDANCGTPKEPRQIQLSREAYELGVRLFEDKNAHAKGPEQEFFEMKQNSTLSIAALNAISRASFEVSEEDVRLAWNLLQFSWDSWLRLSKQSPMEDALSATQKQRRAVMERMVTLISMAGKKGICRKDLRLQTWALRFFKSEEIDEMFDYLDKDVPDIFALTVDAVDKMNRRYTKRLYFLKSTWSIEEAALALPVTKPVWSASAKGFVDSLGNVHTKLTDCVGYRLSWEHDVPSGQSSVAS